MIKPYYKINSPQWLQYDELTDRQFATLKAAARALYKEVREKQVPGTFLVWRIDALTTWGEVGEIVRKYTFTK